MIPITESEQKTTDKADINYDAAQLQEYTEVEALVMKYKTQFEENATDNQIREAKQAAEKLLARFEPLFRKYFNLIITGKIDYEDKEMKRFVSNFIGEQDLLAALRRPFASSKFCHQINKRFAFIVETYGKQDKDIIMIDLQMLFFVLAKRYKQMGKNFCAYMYNAYSYEVARHIKKFTKNPANIPYRGMEYEDYMQTYCDKAIDDCFEDKIYENSQGIPDETWVGGETCSNLFQCLTIEERKLIIKYYLEDFNDRQISEMFSMHINTVNQKRRRAVIKLAKATGVDISAIQRSRKSGKQALVID